MLFSNSEISLTISVSEELAVNRKHALTHFCVFYRSYSKRVRWLGFSGLLRKYRSICQALTVENKSPCVTWDAAFMDGESCPSVANLSAA